MEWRFSDGTSVKGQFTGFSGFTADADAPQEPKEMDVYYIVTDKCTECVGFHDEPQCAAVCPVDCCVDDEDNPNTEAENLQKKESLHL